MLKLYTSCINQFLQDHCEINKIVTTEQAGRKKDVWGCLEQLMINKMILDEVIKHKRSVVMAWLDYQKAFDSVPHEWLLIALKLAKVPPLVISAIETLMQKWSTNLHLTSHEGDIQSNTIHYLRGIFQCDSLSVLLFILSVNPLSFLLKRLKGYQIGPSGKRDTTINHLFFVDDLKLIAVNLNLLKQQLDLVTQFSSDIGMIFGESKCAFLAIDKGKIVESHEVIVMNGVTIKPLKDGDSYKYLGQDENIGYVGPLNKARVTAEYKKRVRKIWSSELSAYNKHIAHNVFALPVLTPTFGIICWTIQEIENLDIITRKILNMTDIDRLYLPRKMGGRGLKSIKLAYECRIISIRQHLLNSTHRNHYLKCVVKHEQHKTTRVGKELLDRFEIEDKSTLTPKATSQKYLKSSLEHMKTQYLQKPLHRYVSKYISQLPEIDQLKSKQWTCNKYMSSHFEAYACAIQEQEIGTKDLISRRNKKVGVHTDNRCRLCKNQVEDMFHVISSCSRMSSRYYLPLRHDAIAKYVYEQHRMKLVPGCKVEYPADEFIHSEGNIEYWWNLSVKTAMKTKNNKPDLIIWNSEIKTCQVVEFSCPADVNVSKKVSEKENIYGPLIRSMQLLYPDYKFEFIPIIVGALGSIPTCLLQGIERLGFTGKESNRIINVLQQKSIIGTVKICKTFLGFAP